MTDAMSTTQRMVHTVYGKQVYLIKMTDRLTTRVKSLSDALRTVEKTFRAWQAEFRAFAKTEQCHHDASLEFHIYHGDKSRSRIPSAPPRAGRFCPSGREESLHESQLVSMIYLALFQPSYRPSSLLFRL